MGFFGIFPKKSYNFSTNKYYIDIKIGLETLVNFVDGGVLVFLGRSLFLHNKVVIETMPNMCFLFYHNKKKIEFS